MKERIEPPYRVAQSKMALPEGQSGAFEGFRMAEWLFLRASPADLRASEWLSGSS